MIAFGKQLLRTSVGSVRQKSTLVLAEFNGPAESVSLAASVCAAKKIGYDIDILVTGNNDVATLASEVAHLDDVKNVIFSHLVAPLPNQIAYLLYKIQKDKKFTHMIATQSTFSKDFMPRAAAHFDVQPISDVIEIVDPDTFVRPIYAGNAISKVRSIDNLKMITIRPTSFQSSSSKSTNKKPISEMTVDKADAEKESFCFTTEYVKKDCSVSDRPQLANAKVVVSGGRGLKDAANFSAILDPLCAKLNAALGASRAAVDAGFCANDLQVGQTGKVVAPELYIAVGISGAIQHVAGMKDSKKIVAINKDAEAPIFAIADYGLVGDAFEIIPQLTAKI
eukprot:GHVL01009462.1.p1 GENE.GHVL01009462.1~~GHVL01009462.1.p1  ORF type:complete len:337 (-),score=48.03 GHVL01009462.1:1649-2659(-)